MRWSITTQYNEVDAAHKTPHQGIDIGCPIGTPIHAVKDGVVEKIMHEGGNSFGNSIWVKSSEGKEFIYGHLSKITAHLHSLVHKGDVIALSGNSGDSTGPHIHLQVMVPRMWYNYFTWNWHKTEDPTSYASDLFQGVTSMDGWQAFVPDVIALGGSVFFAFRLIAWLSKS